jgi:hypothetical protein
MTDKAIAICITGWHFHEAFFRQLTTIPDVDAFVVSHRAKSDVPDYVFQCIPVENIFFEPNVGYDWGCYQQFLDREIWRDYQYLFFMHDDIVIRDTGFIASTVELLDYGKKLVGNGRDSDKDNFPKTLSAYYAHSHWKPPNRDFRHRTIRGSFFGTTNQTLQELGNFEIFWDKFKLTEGFGNYSLVASCGKMTALFGYESIGYLSLERNKSRYIIELVRGGHGRSATKIPLINRLLIFIVVSSCRGYMSLYYSKQQKIVQRIMHAFIMMFAKR